MFSEEYVVLLDKEYDLLRLIDRLDRFDILFSYETLDAGDIIVYEITVNLNTRLVLDNMLKKLNIKPLDYKTLHT